MKVSDPILFGHMVRQFYKDVFDKHQQLFTKLGVNPNNGIGDLYEKIKGNPAQAEIEQDISNCYAARPGLAMVDSSKGITNLHVPSDVIIDASMPCVVRDGGAMWNKADKLEQVKCVIPDRSYSTMYQAVLEDCRQHGQFDWTVMGHTSNVGLMAQKAEEYGSHDKTFQMTGPGQVRVVTAAGKVLTEHSVDGLLAQLQRLGLQGGAGGAIGDGPGVVVVRLHHLLSLLQQLAVVQQHGGVPGRQAQRVPEHPPRLAQVA